MTNTVKFPKIKLSADGINEIHKKLNVSKVTVRLSLRWKSLSEKSEEIRQMAKVILLREAAKVDNTEIIED